MINKINQKWILTVGLLLLMSLIVPTLPNSLQGIHRHRQADTLFAGYSYCTENSDFLKPRIAHRQNTEGVSIGELPLFSYLTALPCKLGFEWSEIFSKILALLFFALSAVVWGRLLALRLNISLNWPLWLCIFIFSPLNLAHLSIPIPDGLALFLMGLSGLFFHTPNSKNVYWYRLLGILSATISFAIRPYLVLLIFFAAPSWQLALLSFVPFVAFYLWWFKSWIHQSQISYYATELRTLSQLAEQLPKAIPNALWQIVRNHSNFLGIFPLYLALRKFPLIGLLWTACFAMVFVAKGDHLINHNYYLMGAGCLSMVLIYLGMTYLSPQTQKGLSAFMIVLGISSTAHFWTNNHNKETQQIQSEVNRLNIHSDQKLATFRGDSPITLYLARRVGWMFPPEFFDGACPLGASFYIIDEQNLAKAFVCEKFKSSTH